MKSPLIVSLLVVVTLLLVSFITFLIFCAYKKRVQSSNADSGRRGIELTTRTARSTRRPAGYGPSGPPPSSPLPTLSPYPSGRRDIYQTSFRTSQTWSEIVESGRATRPRAREESGWQTVDTETFNAESSQTLDALMTSAGTVAHFPSTRAARTESGFETVSTLESSRRGSEDGFTEVDLGDREAEEQRKREGRVWQRDPWGGLQSMEHRDRRVL